VSNADCFRIGTVGRISVADVQGQLAAIGETLVEMEIALT
jgi:aspartate aminotransferase-like enzyme